jgi:outer membrane protein OmpA-like peptidoglycan-associated protein
MFVGRDGCKSRSAAVYLSAIVVLLLTATSAFAQTDASNSWDLFVGYQWLHPGATIPLPFDNPSAPSAYTVPDLPGGFGLAGAYNFDPHWAGEIDFGDNQTTNNSETTFSFGPRFMWRTDYAHYFLHALLSDNRLSVNGSGNNGIGAILGGGMDLPITKNIAFRLFEADYVWARHNYADDAAAEFPNLRRASLEGTRLRTGLVLSWGGTEPLTPAASCTVQPSEVMVGEPITATVTASNFNPKHTVVFVWSGNGVTGKDTTATIDTTNAAPGSYTISAKVTDPKEHKNNEASCSANYTIKPLPPKNPPTMSISANPTELVTGGSVNLSANCTSPDGVPVSVANWTSSAGTVSGSGTAASFNTAGLPPGTVTITATCTDSRGLTAQATTQVTIDAPPPPPVDKALEARLALHSVYFPTNVPPPNRPNAPMVASQQQTLMTLATDFKKYLEAKPDAHLILEGHADIRGSDAYNQALSERRVERVRAYLVEQGVPESDIEVKAYGKERNLTLEEVKASVEKNTELTTEERRRALARINVIKLASNRRVDVTLKAGAQTENSVREFPFNAADAMTLIGGRTPAAGTAPAPRKRAAPKKKPQ